MTPERWRVIEELYHSASAMSASEREPVLRAACGRDNGLFDEVNSLLMHGSPDQSILDSPAFAVVAQAIAADEDEFSAPLIEGQTLSHYRIVRAIGRGGMGVVYKAEDLKLKRHAALKLLPRSLARDPQALQRFEREAQAASALNHPNICTVYEIDESDGLPFIAIELLDGETLKERIARGPLEIREILGIVVQICDALEAAHSAGIIHRDIKPSNIIFTRQGTAKLLDFGVAKRLGSELTRPVLDLLAKFSTNADLRLTSPGAAIGTVAYMSPEQASGLEVDARSDLFSLGAVLYELTTGKCPFPGTDVSDVLRAIQERTPIPITKLRPKTSSELIRVTNRAMQKDRSQRHESAAAMRVDLQTLRMRLESRPARRKALLVPMVVMLFFTAIAAGSLKLTRVREWVWGKTIVGEPHKIKSVAVLPLENLSGDASQDYFADGMTDALITNLTKLSSLRVISRTSSMHYKGTRKTLAEIGNELNVSNIVEGTVVRYGGRVRIGVQLADARTGQNLWAGKYDRDFPNILQLQNELAVAVAEELAGRLSPQEQSGLTQSRAVNPDAYENYLRGRYFATSVRTEEGLKKAEDYLTRAIQQDSNYAPAFVYLSDVYCKSAWSVVGWLDPKIAGPKAIEAANKAVQLDSNLPQAHLALATARSLYEGKSAQGVARRETDRAIQLNPNDANSLFASADLLDDRKQACKQIRTAHQLDPLNPVGFGPLTDCLFAEGNYEQAIAEARKAVELYPQHAGLHDLLSGLYQRRGRYPEAIAEIQEYKSLGGLCADEALVHALGGAGRRAEAERKLKQLQHRPDWDMWCAALAYVGLGRNDEAIRALQEGTLDGGGIRATGWRWEFDPLKSDPRFQEILKRGEQPY